MPKPPCRHLIWPGDDLPLLCLDALHALHAAVLDPSKFAFASFHMMGEYFTSQLWYMEGSRRMPVSCRFDAGVAVEEPREAN